MDEDYERGGWIALAVGGVVGLLFGAVYLVWSVISALMGGLLGLAAIGAAIDSGDIVSALPTIFIALTPLIQLVVYVIVPIMALVVLFSAFRYKSYQSKGLVWLGIIVNVLIPVLALVSSLGSCCATGGCCGFIFGNIGTIIVGAIALGTSGYAAYTLMQEDVAAKFEANATE